MDVRFEDHPGFQRAAMLSALGAAAVGAFALGPAAAAGSAVALALDAGLSRRERMRRGVLALACGAAALLAQSGPAWFVALCGALLGISLAVARMDATLKNGATPPSAAQVTAAAALCGAVFLFGCWLLPSLAAALQPALPGRVANAIAGAALGLWTGLAAAPLYLVFGGDAVEARMAALRPLLSRELLVLADRAVAALRGAMRDLPQVAPDLRGALEQLALSALSLAERISALDRAASRPLENELRQRSAQLAASAAESTDDAVRQSYLRASDALAGQLDHFRRVRLARSRALAQLHEDVVSLERARFSLTLVRGADPAAELQLLRDRLEHRAVAFEAEGELAAPSGVRAV